MRRTLTRGELTSAVCAVLLLFSMFAVEWFGVDGIPGRTPKLAYAIDAWNGLPLVRWVMLVTVLVTIGSAALHVNQHGHGAKTDTGLVVAVLAWLTVGLLIYRVLIDLPASQQIVDQKFGALVGLALAIGLAIGASDTVRQERELGEGRSVAHKNTSDGADSGRYW